MFTLYVSEAPYRLLPLQHWSQQIKDPEETFCLIKHEKIENPIVTTNDNNRGNHTIQF